MGILHLSTEPLHRGGERQLQWIHESLCTDNVKSIIICNIKNTSLSTLPETYSFNAKGIYLYTTFLYQAYRVLQKVKPTIVHCHDNKALSIGVLLKKLYPFFLISTKKTIYPLKKTAIAQFRYSQIDRFVVISNAVKKTVLPAIPEEKITIIHDGIDTAVKLLSRKEISTQWRIPEDSFIIGTVGYFTREKNLPLLLKTADHLMRYNCRATICVIGFIPETYKEEIYKRPNIIAVGIVENAVQYYSLFDLYISCSTREGLGSALLDALIRNIPTIALDSQGSQDIYPKNYPYHITHEEEFPKVIYDAINNFGQLQKTRAALTPIIKEKFSRETLYLKHKELYSECQKYIHNKRKK